MEGIVLTRASKKHRVISKGIRGRVVLSLAGKRLVYAVVIKFSPE
jgi:hypothetical protein